VSPNTTPANPLLLRFLERVERIRLSIERERQRKPQVETPG
jgi:hypothetical protein